MKKYLVIADNSKQSEDEVCSGIERGIELAMLSGQQFTSWGLHLNTMNLNKPNKKI